jgi:hypothetical protein
MAAGLVASHTAPLVFGWRRLFRLLKAIIPKETLARVLTDRKVRSGEPFFQVPRRPSRVTNGPLARRFYWLEPKPAIAARSPAPAKKRVLLAFVLTVLTISVAVATFSLILPAPATAPFPEFGNLTVFALCAGLVGVTGVWLAAWHLTTHPGKIFFDDRRIYIHRRMKPVFFSNFESFTWRSTPDFFTLVLTPYYGDDVLIRAPRDIPVDAISEFLAKRVGEPAGNV